MGCSGSQDPVDPDPPLVLHPSDLCSNHSNADIATFEDANLAAVIVTALGVGGQDDLTCGLLAGLADLAANNAGIVSLLGIQNLTILRNLNLREHSITDISPLSGLTSLTSLDLPDNSASDVSALRGWSPCTERRGLAWWGCSGIADPSGR